MNAELARRWTELVKPNDVVWVLGDVAMGRRDDTLAIVDSLPGTKHLIIGNHDSCFGGRGSAEKIASETDRYLEVFASVRPNAELLIGPDQVHFDLCHFPYTGESVAGRPDRFTGNRLDDEGGWLLCGHVHNAWKIMGKQVNVGVDVWNYYPVAEIQIVRIIEQAEGKQ